MVPIEIAGTVSPIHFIVTSIPYLTGISRVFVVSNTQISIRVFIRMPRYLQQQILNAEIGDI